MTVAPLRTGGPRNAHPSDTPRDRDRPPGPCVADELDEEARLRALDGLALFGTGHEDRFDRITALARGLFDVGSASITLVGRERQWYKSSQGLDLTSMPRDESFCDHTIRENAALVVEDLTRDARFLSSPHVVAGPRIRFYAGCPLEAPGGQPVGTLCLMDGRPRVFSAAERDALAELARWAQNELSSSAELDRAAGVQRGLLPRGRRLDGPGYQLSAACLPSRTVGGDLVDYYFAADGDVVITLGDVMGKGTGAAIMMATVRAAMRTAGRVHGAAEAVRHAAASLEEDLQKTSTIVTLCHAKITPSTGRLAFADAGHGLCLLVRDGRFYRNAEVGGLPLGIVPDDRWAEATGRLLPGDTLVSFSDGLLDLYDTIEEAFDEVLRVVTMSPDARSVVEHFATLARRYPVNDDVTLFVLRRDPDGGDHHGGVGDLHAD